ncbi:Replication factor C subunit 3 [Dirofilaria immitis]|nr:Replication factor C subunit 3 [Dirofilaria immitis]
MALWVDKYRPHELCALTYHIKQAKDLIEIVKTGDFPHLLVYGPSGSAPSGKKLEIQTFSSNYHVQLSPGEVGIYDRVVIQEIIKQMAQMHQIDTATQRNFKVVVLMEADQMTRDAQNALRRTMEKYAQTCRLILCCDSVSKIIDPLKSRCLAVRVAAPSDDDVAEAVRFVCKQENISIPENIVAAVVQKLTAICDELY